MRLRRVGLAAPLVAAALIATACSSSGGGNPGTNAGGPTSPATTGPTAAATTGPTAPAATTGPKPSISLAMSAAVPQVEKIPTIVAFDKALPAEGYKTKLDYLKNPAQAVQAVAQGSADVGTASQTAVFAAIAKGIPLVAFMESNGPDYAMVAPVKVTGPKGLNGLTLGIHAKVSSTTLYADILLDKYPNVKPKYLIISASANRIRAMIAGQLDSTVAQLSDLPTLTAKAPGKFHVIYNYAKERPDIIDSVMFTKASTLKNDPQLVKAVIGAMLKEHKDLNASPSDFAAAEVKYVPNMTAAVAKANATTYIQGGVYSVGTAFTEQNVTTTMNADKSAGLLTTLPAISTAANFTLLKAAVASLS